MELTRGIVFSIFAQAASGALMRPEDSMPCPKCRLAGREGYLRERKGNKADSQPFLACTTAREECGYITDVPPNKKAAETLTSKACPKCSGALRVKKGKQTGNAFLSCCRYPDCDGVIWLTPKKKVKGEKETAGAKRTPRAA
jgi:ssDNA-binding Zn-finger/Zn-ribbon topoisomerase 1